MTLSRADSLDQLASVWDICGRSVDWLFGLPSSLQVVACGRAAAVRDVKPSVVGPWLSEFRTPSYCRTCHFQTYIILDLPRSIDYPQHVAENGLILDQGGPLRGPQARRQRRAQRWGRPPGHTSYGTQIKMAHTARRLGRRKGPSFSAPIVPLAATASRSPPASLRDQLR
jgi:hypothetical protein